MRFADGRARDRRHRVDRALLQQIPGEDRLRSRQAARFLCHRPREALDFLAPKPVTILPGVGKAAAARFAREGVKTVLDLRTLDPRRMLTLLGNDGARLLRLAEARDERRVTPERETKSVSAETTFDADTK